jgi:hypothetical protein
MFALDGGGEHYLGAVRTTLGLFHDGTPLSIVLAA